MRRLTRLKLFGLACAALAGCSQGHGGSGVFEGLEATDRAVRPAQVSSEAGQVVAYINGREVSREQLWSGLVEDGGGRALREIVLDRELARQVNLNGIEISERSLEAERARMVRALSRDELNEEQIGALLSELRESRGLGPSRFDAFLKRNATLRALVQDQIAVGEAEIKRAFDIVFGERVVVRLIVVATDREAMRLQRALQSVPEGEDISTRFASLAREHSIDPSGDFGGATEPISPIDPAYPRVLRNAIVQTSAGHITPTLAVDGAFALALVEERIEPDQTRSLDAERAHLGQVLRDREERRAMAELADRLVRNARVEIVDRALAWSWERRAR